MIEPQTLLQNRYRVLKQIGQGGMGAVYVATDERFHSTVAIKQTFFDDPALRKAFEREAHLLNHLRHVALPKVSDHFVEGEGQFLVMDFIEGDDLSELLQKRGAFPLADVLRWADELLDALDYLHTHDPVVVHRDIKPQNLKLTTRGQIVLLDFGLAKGATTQTRAATNASVFGYSRNYAPLEQIQGTGTDTRSDLYSLGATLYHLLTGVAPVDALTRAGSVINNQPDPLRPAHRAHAQVPESVSKLLQRALAQKAAMRYQTAAEMRAALRQAASVVARMTPLAATPAHAQSALNESTVLDSLTQVPAGLHASNSALSTLRQRRPAPSSLGETTIVDSSFDVTRPAVRPYVHETADAPARKSPAIMIGIVAAVLVACALVAFPLMRGSSTVTLPDNSDAQTVTPTGASVDSQSAAPNASQREAAGETPNTTSQASGATRSPSLSSSGESQSATGQPSTRGTDAPGVSDVNASGGGADGSRNAPVPAVSSADSSGLVIQSPAPGAQVGNKSAAEYDAQRSEELRRRREQQEQQLREQREREQFRPPPPPPYGEGFPPPGDRPPPRRPPV